MGSVPSCVSTAAAPSPYGRATAPSSCDRFPELAPLAELRLGALLVDAELVCLDADGHPDFFALRTRLMASPAVAATLAPQRPATLMIFDVLHHDGEPVRERPHRERRAPLSSSSWTARRGAFPPPSAPGRCLTPTPLRGSRALSSSVPMPAGGRAARTPGFKVKHRRREWLLVSGRESRSGPRPDRLLLARLDGRYCGDAELGVTTALLVELARRAGPARRGIRPIRPPVEVTVSCGGRPGRALREAATVTPAAGRRPGVSGRATTGTKGLSCQQSHRRPLPVMSTTATSLPRCTRSRWCSLTSPGCWFSGTSSRLPGGAASFSSWPRLDRGPQGERAVSPRDRTPGDSTVRAVSRNGHRLALQSPSAEQQSLARFTLKPIGVVDDRYDPPGRGSLSQKRKCPGINGEAISGDRRTTSPRRGNRFASSRRHGARAADYPLGGTVSIGAPSRWKPRWASGYAPPCRIKVQPLQHKRGLALSIARGIQGLSAVHPTPRIGRARPYAEATHRSTPEVRGRTRAKTRNSSRAHGRVPAAA